MRKAHATISQAGPDGVVAMLQGRLDAGDVLTDAGLSCQPEAPKPAPAAA